MEEGKASRPTPGAVMRTERAVNLKEPRNRKERRLMKKAQKKRRYL